VAVFRQGVFHHGGKGLHLLGARDDLHPDRVVRIARVDQGDKVRRDIHAEQAAGLERFALALGQRDNFFDFFDAIQAMAQLPAPVVPFFIRNIGVDRGAFGNNRGRHRIFLRLNRKRDC
jgi:hypothetical protein